MTVVTTMNHRRRMNEIDSMLPGLENWLRVRKHACAQAESAAEVERKAVQEVEEKIQALTAEHRDLAQKLRDGQSKREEIMNQGDNPVKAKIGIEITNINELQAWLKKVEDAVDNLKTILDDVPVLEVSAKDTESI